MPTTLLLVRQLLQLHILHEPILSRKRYESMCADLSCNLIPRVGVAAMPCMCVSLPQVLRCFELFVLPQRSLLPEPVSRELSVRDLPSKEFNLNELICVSSLQQPVRKL